MALNVWSRRTEQWYIRKPPPPKKGVGFRINTINLIWNMLNMGYQLDIQVKLSKKKMEIEWLLMPKPHCNSLKRSYSQVTHIGRWCTKWSGEDIHSCSGHMYLSDFPWYKLAILQLTLPLSHSYLSDLIFGHHFPDYNIGSPFQSPFL